MKVMIGVDPHKGSHTATMLDRHEHELRRIKVRAGARQVAELLEWADGVKPRTWAVESAGGMGYLLAQQLVAAGETVVNVPAMLASRVRVLASGQSTKSDPNDARSVAVAALRAPTLAPVQRADHTRCAGCWSSITTIWPAGGTSCAVGCTPWSASWCPAGSTAKWSSTRHDRCSPGSSPTMSRRSSGTVKPSSSSPRSSVSTVRCATRDDGSLLRWRRQERR